MNGATPLALMLSVAVWAAAPAQREVLPFSQADADRFASKLTAIVAPVAAVESPPAERRTVVTEPELNAYLRYRVGNQLPVGVVDPYVWALGEGRLAASATVDLDVVRTSRERGWLDPMRFLGGRLPVSATGLLRAVDGVGRFELESASVGSMPVPLSLLQELVTFYSRTPDDPEGVSLDAPFALPAGIRRIDVQTGQAVVLQ